MNSPFLEHKPQHISRSCTKHVSSYIHVLVFFWIISVHSEHLERLISISLLQYALIGVFHPLFVSCHFDFQHVERRWHFTHVKVHGLSLKYHPLTFTLLKTRRLVIRRCNCREEHTNIFFVALQQPQLMQLKDFSSLHTKSYSKNCLGGGNNQHFICTT